MQDHICCSSQNALYLLFPFITLYGAVLPHGDKHPSCPIQAQGDHTQEKAPGLNPQPSCCEVLTTLPPCQAHLKH